jgi:hypothetical protein
MLNFPGILSAAWQFLGLKTMVASYNSCTELNLAAPTGVTLRMTPEPQCVLSKTDEQIFFEEMISEDFEEFE